jgi:glycosyltransferase involved in cell wall biosynthesis
MLLAPLRWSAALSSSRRLSSCNATVAVSRYVRDELALSARIPGEKLYTIPNLVHLPSVRRAFSSKWPLDDISPDDTFALFVGKLDANKGANMLPAALKKAGVSFPVVLAGDGPLRAPLEREAQAAGLDFRFYDWLDNNAILRLMASARVLLFPSAWQEPLSRVLLEGCAAGAAIAALNTGGTSDIIIHDVSGWLASDPDDFAQGVHALATDDALNARLRAGARLMSETVFAAPVVSAEIESLYSSLLEDLPERAA